MNPTNCIMQTYTPPHVGLAIGNSWACILADFREREASRIDELAYKIQAVNNSHDEYIGSLTTRTEIRMIDNGEEVVR